MDDGKGRDIALVQEELRIDLQEGYAECMGDGLFILFQTVEGSTQSVVLSQSDLSKLLEAA